MKIVAVGLPLTLLFIAACKPRSYNNPSTTSSAGVAQLNGDFELPTDPNPDAMDDESVISIAKDLDSDLAGDAKPDSDFF